MRRAQLSCLLLGAALLGGCASLPSDDCLSIAGDPRQTPVRVATTRLGFDEITTWGGILLNSFPDAQGCTLQALSFPLDACGRPQLDQPRQGCFRIRLRADEPFGDCATLAHGSLLTVTGRIGPSDPPHKLPQLTEAVVYAWPGSSLSSRPPLAHPQLRPGVTLGIGSSGVRVGGGLGIGF
ncbi:MAG: Slp family lipoprotein [Chromatiaceae bacterium]|nr:Slp family lipoprotein [Chromatiaceae bacterium]